LARRRFNLLVTQGAGNREEAAGLFYYLNRTGYNGLCRFNRRGLFNVPFGRHEHIEYVRDFTVYRAALERWTFLAGDFEDVAIDPDDFIYADPPYDAAFTSYAGNPFTWDDQVRAAKWLAGHAGPIVLSNQATPRIVELYRTLGFQIRFLTAPRSISCKSDRPSAREVLATRNLNLGSGE
jgi:DNA adenine methylase